MLHLGVLFLLFSYSHPPPPHAFVFLVQPLIKQDHVEAIGGGAVTLTANHWM